MPSPFPGMDPFIEGQAWETFHHLLISFIQESLTPQLRPRYVVRIEERVYVEHSSNGGGVSFVRPDLSVTDRRASAAAVRELPSAGTAVAVAPVLVELPMPERRREAFLVVRDRDVDSRVVTVVEALSPGNKRSGSDGRREYLSKREEILQTGAHLVELDMLRGGERLPTVEPLPAGDYFVFVCRANRRPMAEVYPILLRNPLPALPVPLAENDPDASVDLQAALATIYDRAGYDYSLDYRRDVTPPFQPEDAGWLSEILNSG